jgi:2-haloacid dehalogenase
VAVRAVVFDVGNVLYDWHPRYLYARLIPDHAALELFLRDVVTLEWHHQHDEGRDFAATSAELASRYPEHRDLIAAWGPRFNESIGPAIPGVTEIVEELEAAEVPLFAITNFSHEFWPSFRAQEAALFDRFRDIIVSGVEKLAKPNPAIYQLAHRRFGLAPGEAIFIDDRADNIASAEANGFIGHHFRDAATLRAELTDRGLLSVRSG